MTFEDKKSARAHFLALRSSLSPSLRNQKSEKICERLLRTKDFLACDTILLYYPIKSEPNTLLLFQKAIDAGVSVAFPISDTKSYSLDFRSIGSLDDMSTGAYGICEPSPDSPRAKITEKTICIVPALSFDAEKNRLGYGKGFYDRFLKGFSGKSIGITYSELICERLPFDENDIRVDEIITD